jgi:hypothetical protein
LTTVGEVYVNDSPAPAESTIFSGDRVRSGDTGTATFTMSGKGTLKISPQSRLVFPGRYEYLAEFQAGTVVLNSISGPNGLTLRTGNYVLVPSIREQSATSKIDRAPDGSFLISCLGGSVGVLTLQGSSGEFLQVGEGVTVSSKGELSVVLSSPQQPLSGSSGPNLRPKKGAQNFHSGWLLLGLAGAGAAAATLTQGAGKQSVSPSLP